MLDPLLLREAAICGFLGTCFEKKTGFEERCDRISSLCTIVKANGLLENLPRLLSVQRDLGDIQWTLSKRYTRFQHSH